MNSSLAIQIQGIYISDGHDFFGRVGRGAKRHSIVSLEKVKCVAGKGLEGDRFYNYRPRYKGQVTFIGRTSIDAVNQQPHMKAVPDSTFRRNIVVDGVSLNDLIGKHFSINDVHFLGTEECSPCFWMDTVAGREAQAILTGRGGLRCRILESGSLTLGANTLTVI